MGKKMTKYIHKVQYYETDKMAVTHHSNYLRWMEEARVDFLDQIGWNYRKLEDSGISSPVLNLTCRYRHSTTFDDTIEITTRVTSLSFVRLCFSYEMRHAGTEKPILCTGTSEHCFLDSTGHPMNLKKDCPEIYEALKKHYEIDNPQEK